MRIILLRRVNVSTNRRTRPRHESPGFYKARTRLEEERRRAWCNGDASTAKLRDRERTKKEPDEGNRSIPPLLFDRRAHPTSHRTLRHITVHRLGRPVRWTRATSIIAILLFPHADSCVARPMRVARTRAGNFLDYCFLCRFLSRTRRRCVVEAGRKELFAYLGSSISRERRRRTDFGTSAAAKMARLRSSPSRSRFGHGSRRPIGPDRPILRGDC